MTQRSALEQLLGRARGPMGPAIEGDFGVARGPLAELGQVISRMNGFFLFNGGIQVFRVGCIRAMATRGRRSCGQPVDRLDEAGCAAAVPARRLVERRAGTVNRSAPPVGWARTTKNRTPAPKCWRPIMAPGSRDR